MGAKKNEHRFTIQFSSTDPKHLQVSEILNRQGRRKAQYLVNAVLIYENEAETNSSGPPSPLNYHAIEAIVNQILTEKAAVKNEPIKQLTTQQGKKVRGLKEIKINFEDVELELGQDGLSAIADSIAAFRKHELDENEKL